MVVHVYTWIHGCTHQGRVDGVIQYLGSHLTHMSLLFCLCVFCDSFLCSISLLLLSGSLSYISSSVYVVVHVYTWMHACTHQGGSDGVLQYLGSHVIVLSVCVL